MEPIGDQPKRNSGKTGPRTAQGKAASSYNAFKHGLRSEKTVLRHEDPAEYAALLQTWFNSYATCDDDIAFHLVELTANAHWRLKRAQKRLDEIEFDLPADPRHITVDGQTLYTNHLRYKNAHERSFFRSLNELSAHLKRIAKTDLVPEPTTVLSIMEQRLEISLAGGKITTTFIPTNQELRDSVAALAAPPMLIKRVLHFVEGPPYGILWSTTRDMISDGPATFQQRFTWHSWSKAAAIENDRFANTEPYNLIHPDSMPVQFDLSEQPPAAEPDA